jgi:hypothetical protein
MTQARAVTHSELRRLAKAWVIIVALGGLELLCGLTHLSHGFRPLILLPGIGMIATVAWQFMEIHKGPVLVRAFAVGALFFLFVLLALGSVDPLTRTDYKMPDQRSIMSYR